MNWPYTMPPWVWVTASGILHTNVVKFFLKPTRFSGHKEGSKPCHTMREKRTGLSRGRGQRFKFMDSPPLQVSILPYI